MKPGELAKGDKVSLVRTYCYSATLKQQPPAGRLSHFRCFCRARQCASVSVCGKRPGNKRRRRPRRSHHGQCRSASIWRPIVGCNRAAATELAWQGFNQTFAVVIAWPLFAELLARASENTSAQVYCPSGSCSRWPRF